MTIDLSTIIGNVSRSIAPIEHLLTGLAYMLGILFFWTAISKLRKIGDSRTSSSSQEKIYSPIAYLIMGSFLLFLPSAVNMLANTAFGAGNVIGFVPYNPYNFFSSMSFIIQAAGIIWFIRGAVLLAHASEPGVKHGKKGLFFLCAGVLAINFNSTVAILTWIMNQLTSLNININNTSGF